MDSFGKRFKEERLKKRLTQEQLANEFHLKKSSISRYEHDKQMPEIQLLQKFSDFFGVSTDFLLNGSYDDKVDNQMNKEYSDQVQKAADLFSELNDKHQNIVLDLIEELLNKNEKKS